MLKRTSEPKRKQQNHHVKPQWSHVNKTALEPPQIQIAIESPGINLRKKPEQRQNTYISASLDDGDITTDFLFDETADPESSLAHKPDEEMDDLSVGTDRLEFCGFHDGSPVDSSWTYEEQKSFEVALAEDGFDDSDEQTWLNLLPSFPARSVKQLKQQYMNLLHDLSNIETGSVQQLQTGTEHVFSRSSISGSPTSGSKQGGKKGTEQERKKGIPWTEEEHKLFLVGLAKFGKGDWRSISRNYVVSRTPTQVASHAQKYFIRLNSMNKDKRRTSIHDITSVNNRGAQSLPAHQPSGPMIGQRSQQPAMYSSMPLVQHQMMPMGPPPVPGMNMGIGMGFGPRPQMGRPVMSSPRYSVPSIGYISQPMHH